jgi:ankyrin repeat protein
MASEASVSAFGNDSAQSVAQLLIACKTGDPDAVRELLGKNPFLATAEIEFGPLHCAVRGGHTRIVQLLLEQGADPDSVTHNIWGHRLSTLDIAKARGFAEVVALVEVAVQKKQRLVIADNPLRRALKDNDLDAIKRIVSENPALVNVSDEHGNTPLHRAAGAEESPGYVEFIHFLLQHGAEINVPNNLGFTPVYVTLFRNQEYAYARPRWRSMQLLLDNGAEYDINLAAAKGDVEQVRAFLATDPHAVDFLSPCKKRPLSCAAEFGHRDIVELLLKAGADPNAPEREWYHTFPLVAAAARNDLAMAEMLLEHGADPNASIDAAEVALGEALNHGNQELANLIASYGGVQPVHCHAWDGDVVTLAAVLHQNPALALQAIYIPNPNRPKEAAQVLRLALRHGLDPKLISHWSLYRASGNADLLRVFLKAGANPNVSAGEGRTLLHYLAFDAAAKESVKVLIEFGADINARDEIFRGTPLTWAVLAGNQEMVEFWLATGAAIELPDDDANNTPTFWAKYLGHSEILRVLSGADGGASHGLL